MAFLAALADGLRTFFASYELPALLLILIVEEAGIPLPLPGYLLVMLAAANAGAGVWHAPAVVAISTVALFVGSSLLYGAARWRGRATVLGCVRFLRIREERLHRLEGWVQRRGPAALILGRLIPNVRNPTSLMAGLCGIPYRVFAPCTVAAALIWSLAYFLLGTGCVALKETLNAGIQAPHVAVTLAAVALVIVGVGAYRRTRHAARPSRPS